MTHPRRLAVLFCCIAALLVCFPERGSGDDTAGKTTTLKIRVHLKRARVTIDEKPIDVKTGLERTVTAPPLAEGKKEYEVTVTWAPNNYTRFYRTRKVAPKGMTPPWAAIPLTELPIACSRTPKWMLRPA